VGYVVSKGKIANEYSNVKEDVIKMILNKFVMGISTGFSWLRVCYNIKLS
jgi:hypothetical protein